MLAISAIAICLPLLFASCSDKKKDETQKKQIINRTFLNCTFGDEFQQCKSRLLKSDFQIVSEEMNNGRGNIVLANVNYANTKLDTLSFGFNKGKLYRVWMAIGIEAEDQAGNWTFNSFKDMFRKHGYEKDTLVTNYNNVESFCDNLTDLRLFHTFKMEPPHQVTITYTDKANSTFGEGF